MGYQGIEFFGYLGESPDYRDHNPRELRKLLDDNGLKCCGMHVRLPAIEGDAFRNTIELNTVLGNGLVIVAAAKRRITSADSVKKLAEQFSEVARCARPYGLRVGYHGHGFDFQEFEGRMAWDLLFSYASPDVVMQLDVGNCLAGGADPIAILRKFAERAASLHVREPASQPLHVTNPFWRELFRVATSRDALQWLVVEQAGKNSTDLEVPGQCLRKLRRMHV